MSIPMPPNQQRSWWVPMLSLFGSMSTLVCCALPALLVSIGAGATLAGIVSELPWLVALSKYKAWTFGVSGFLLVLAALSTWRARHQPCPADPAMAAACQRLRKLSIAVLIASAIIWLTGFFFAFLAVWVFFD